jgi:hypothetical protein
MTKPTIREHNMETDQVIDREMTDDEYAFYEASNANLQANLKAEQDKAATKQAVLDKLDLTADEVAALLG